MKKTKNQMKPVLKKLFTFVVLVICLAPLTSFASTLSLSTEKSNLSLDEAFLVQVYLDTEDVSVNAIEGILKFPPNLLSLKEIRDGNSSINFWVEKPSSKQVGEVSFSGITTGGFSGSHKYLFSLVLQAKKNGNGAITFNDVQILENDGLGTTVKTKTNPINFSVTSGDSGTGANLQVIDTEPPESFSPLVARDTSIFNGQNFIVFSTVDKGSGMDHFEIREGLWGEYVPATSPYLLSDQSLSKNIYIIAFDKLGNSRLVKLPAQNSTKHFLLGMIIVIICSICIFYLRKFWPTFLKR